MPKVRKDKNNHDVMTAEEAIKRIKDHMDVHRLSEALSMAIAAIREREEPENPKPLTLDELRQMDGQPVWVRANHYGECYVHFRINYWLQENGHGKSWLAYRSKPKEDI